MRRYDIIIMGAGLGGLTAGAILSREGKHVCVVEKHFQLGGSLQNFQRNGVVFDTGAHYIGGFSPGQSLYQFFKFLGIENELDLKELDREAFDAIDLLDSGEEFFHANGYDAFVERLAPAFPGRKEELSSYIREMKSITDQFPLFQLKKKEYSFLETSVSNISINTFLNKVTDSVKLQNVLSGSNLLYAGERFRTPAYVHALIHSSYIESAHRFIGGASQLTEKLADIIRNNGGEVYANTEVKEINFKGKRISHINTEDGESWEADEFISNIHPQKTFSMIDEGMVRKSYYNRIMNMDNTIGIFSLYIVLKKDAFPYLNRNHYIYSDKDVWAIDNYATDNWPQACMFLTHADQKEQEYARGVTVLAYMSYDEVKRWENTFIDDRGEDYLRMKNEKKEKLLSFVESRFPGFKLKVDNVYTSTPLTYKDYTGTEQGSLYGVRRDCIDPMKNMLLPKTKIPNLSLVGQNTTLHGVLGVTIGAVLVAGRFLGFDYLIDKVLKA